MSLNVTRKITSSLIALIVMSIVVAPEANADGYYDKGTQLFAKRQYAAARPYFDKAAENAPWDSNAFYYQALTAQYLKDWKSAKVLWAGIIDRFPGTPAAINATVAMKALDPGFFRRPRAGAGATASAGTSSASTTTAAAQPDNADAALANVQFTSPAQARIPITRTNDRVIVDAQVNNRALKIEFNGAQTALNLKDAAAMGIVNADRTPLKAGTRKPVPMRIGDIATASFPIAIEDIERSRIGDDFFRKFSYSLEPSVLVVTKKASSGGGRTSYDVPFRKQGTDMLVEVTMNGRRCNMIFDQEGGECIVPRKRTKEFGLDVQESSAYDIYDAEKQSGPLRGETGFGEVKTKQLAEAKMSLGPVANQVIQVRVDDTAKEAKIGGGALGGWKFSIDPGASLIRFSR